MVRKKKMIPKKMEMGRAGRALRHTASNIMVQKRPWKEMRWREEEGQRE